MTVSLPALALMALSLNGMPDNNPASSPFRFDRAELSSPAQAMRVLERIEQVAHSVCVREHRHSATTPDALASCRQDTVARTLDQIGSPCLTSVHNARLDDREQIRCNVQLTRRTGHQ